MAITSVSASAAQLPLKWERPDLSDDAIVIDLATAGGKTYWQFADNQDVIFINSGASPVGSLKVEIVGD